MKLTKKQYKNIIIASLTLLLHTLPYISNLFYVQFQEYYQVSNVQIGWLLSCFGFVTIIGYFFGGMVADRFKTKTLLVSSTFLAGILAMVMCFTRSFYALCVIQLGLGIAAAVMQWSAFLKYVRFSGSDEQQGKLYGVFELAAAIMGVFTGYVVLAFMNVILTSVGFGFVVFAYGVLTIIFGVVVAVFLDTPEYEETANDQTGSGSGFNLSMLSAALKLPVTWFNAIMLFGLYLVTGLTAMYINPLLQNVFGMSATFVIAVGMFKRYAFRIFLAPAGGAAIDKLKGSSMIIAATGVLSVILLLIMAFVPLDSKYTNFFFVITLLLGVVTTFVRPAYYTPVSEANTPKEITGTVIGIVSAIGYCVDLWGYSLCGSWLDKYGTAGYRYIWILCAVCSAIVAVTAVIYGKYINNLRKKTVVE